MNKKSQVTRLQVIDAAVKLFHMNGYTGTSVRDIATEAGVNVALVSYYFGGKKGLLEYLMSSFLEGYIYEIEAVAETMEKGSVVEQLLKVADRLLKYQQEHYYLSRFVHREFTMDTMLIRELMVTYLMKEKYLLKRIIEKGIRQKELIKLPVDFAVIHFREMMISPFSHPQYVREVFSLRPESPKFRKEYLKYINHWLKSFSCEQNQVLASHA